MRFAQNKSDWILVVERTEDGVAQMDALAKSLGYNTVPLTIGAREAISLDKVQSAYSTSTIDDARN